MGCRGLWLRWVQYVTWCQGLIRSVTCKDESRATWLRTTWVWTNLDEEHESGALSPPSAQLPAARHLNEKSRLSDKTWRWDDCGAAGRCVLVCVCTGHTYQTEPFSLIVEKIANKQIWSVHFVQQLIIIFVTCVIGNDLVLLWLQPFILQRGTSARKAS